MTYPEIVNIIHQTNTFLYGNLGFPYAFVLIFFNYILYWVTPLILLK